MLRDYGCAVVDVTDNLYGVAHQSCIDFVTFQQVMFAENLQFEVVEPLPGCEGTVRTQEKFISPDVAAELFSTLLGSRVERKTVKEIDVDALAQEYDIVLDCTNNNLFKDDVVLHQQKTVSLVYRSNLVDQPLRAWTVMDGEFISLYPWDVDKRLFSLTHVKHTVVDKFPESTAEAYQLRQLFEADAVQFIPDFLTNFTFVDFFTSEKSKRRSCSADRQLYSHRHANNVWSFSCGKITGIYDMEAELAWCL